MILNNSRRRKILNYDILMDSIHTSNEISPVPFSIEDFSPISIDQKSIINMINHLHFSQSQLFLYVKNKVSGDNFFIKATPYCVENTSVSLRYTHASSFDHAFMSLMGIAVDDGQKIMIIQIFPEKIEKCSVKVFLGETVGVWNKRKTKRHQCTGIRVNMEMGTFNIQGFLLNFSSRGFRVGIYQQGISDKIDLTTLSLVMTTLYKDDHIIYKGACTVVRADTTDDNPYLILKNSSDTYNHYTARTFRNPRHKLIPTPKIMLRHPVLNRYLRYEISDLSTSGFSICEASKEGFFMPGMIFHNTSILFLGNYKLSCSTQLVYNSKQDQSILKHGFVFLDMNIKDYDYLFSVLVNAYDRHINYMTTINTESLWSFFFSSGFIYQKKYTYIIRNIKNLKAIYRRLYKQAVGIFRCITYERNGAVFGHVSMIKAYPGIWMVHHLAAVPIDGKHIGIHILHQIINYLEGPFRLPSSDMDFLMFYYRPENKFPEFFFTTACAATNDRKICSIDLFDYVSCHLSNKHIQLPNNWELEELSTRDLDQLINNYENESGGLLLDALCISLQKSKEEPIDNEYHKYNLKRKFSIHALKLKGMIKAAFIVDQSDIGVNLSELLNSIKIIISDSEGLEWDFLYNAICILGSIYKRKTLPIMVFPSGHRCLDTVTKEKRYRLLIINKIKGIDYLDQLKKLGNFVNPDP